MKEEEAETLKEREENYKKAMEKLQRENEEMKNKLSELTPIQVKLNYS